MILYLASIVDLVLIFAYNNQKLLRDIKMDITKCIVSPNIDELMNLLSIFSYNNQKLLRDKRMNITDCFVSASIDELMKTVPFNQWTPQKLYDIMQKNCPGGYTIENDNPGGIGYRVQFNSDKDAAWFLLQYRTDG
jgi:hypothetical protein